MRTIATPSLVLLLAGLSLAPSAWSQAPAPAPAAAPAVPPAVPAPVPAPVPVLPPAPWATLPAPTLQGLALGTARHSLTLAPTGLPAQWSIKATPLELPLELRAAKEVSAEDLRPLGRGDQLRAPIRLEAAVGGQALTLEAVAPVTPVVKDQTVVATSELKAGSLTGKLAVVYERDGALRFTLDWQPGADKVDSLTLVLDLQGSVDTLILNQPVGDKLAAVPASRYALRDGEGRAWGNAPADAGEGGQAAPGLVTHAFVGSGDRGFTWLAEPGAGWALDPAQSSMTLERDKAGLLSWRIALANLADNGKAARQVSGALLLHPSTSKPADFRRLAWLHWPAAGTTAPASGLALADRAKLAEKPASILRADAATVHEALASARLLTGVAGGAAISKDATLGDTLPPVLFRYLAGTATGQVGRLVPNAGNLIRPGQHPGNDLVALGRALVHDLGVDPRGLAHRQEAVKLVAALHGVGFFDPASQLEFVPYWRSQAAMRFGEEFKANDAFATTATDPLAQVCVSYWRLPFDASGKQSRVLILILNEGPTAVREQLYLYNAGKLMGGPSKLTEAQLMPKLSDFSHIPKESDWRQDKLVKSSVSMNAPSQVLHDLIDGGVVIMATKTGSIEVFGPIHLPARSYRLLLASPR